MSDLLTADSKEDGIRRTAKIVLAFDAIRDLGPDAWPAVEELTRIVAEPFTPVRIGVDRDDLIAAQTLKHSPSR